MSGTNGTSPVVASIESERGLPVSISCSLDQERASSSSATAASATAATESPPQQTLTLLFGYEFALVDPRERIGGEVIQQDLPKVEYTLLYYVAEAIGLLECDVATQRTKFISQQQQADGTAGGGGGQIAAGAATTSDEVPMVVGLSNLQPDQWESEIVCSELVDLPPDLICLPLRGIMQATFVGKPDDAAIVERMLSSTIEAVLNGENIFSEGIVDTIYIGSRVIDGPPAPTPADQSSSSTTPWIVNPAVLGPTLSLVAVLGIVGGLLLHRRRRKRSHNQRSEVIPDLPMNKHKVVMDIEPEITEQDESSLNKTNSSNNNSNQNASRDLELQDQEIPSVDPLLISIATTRTASETITDTDESLQDGSLNTTGTTRTHSPLFTPPSLLDNTSNNLPPSVINLQPRPKDSNGAALIRPPPSPSSGANNKKPPLPTKPPVPSSSPRSSSASAAAAAALSKPLKQQRRKKKRKKKPKMIRVSSRERANEMETITETAEEIEIGEDGEQQEGDNDSEYSWYSETDSNASSSRDVSPSRGSPVPSSSSSEDQIMVQLHRSLDSPNQLLLSCGSSSKDDDDEDDDGNDSGGEQEIVNLLAASTSSSPTKDAPAAGEDDGAAAAVGSSGEDNISTTSTKSDQSRGSSPVPSYWK